MTKPLMKLFFEEWWEAMPLAWQKGFYEALAGGAFRGDCPSPGSDKPEVVVYFVHASLADRVDRAIEGPPDGSEGK